MLSDVNRLFRLCDGDGAVLLQATCPDFGAQAFDSIDWLSLRKVLLARSFSPVWCDWIDAIFHFSMSVMLLNNVLGS
jgi:hypothetical protein